MQRKSIHLWGCAVLALSLLISTAARAASINYGNSPTIAPGITFLGVTESSGTDAVPLFGAPSSFFPVGIDFNPSSFVASGTGGAGDITDGQLNFGIAGTFTPTVKVAINQVNLSESGDYTLIGTGTAVTQVVAAASIHVTVTEIDGVALALPIVLSPTNSNVGFNLAANPGILQPWNLNGSLNVAAALTNMAVPFTYGATKLEVVIDNSLVALSQPNTIASIAKKDFKVSTVNNVVLVPEPAGMAFLALVAVGTLRRRRD